VPDISIGQVARLGGVSTSAIRFYEKYGLLAEPPRRSGRRCYDPSIILQVRRIAGARNSGLSLARIKELLGQAENKDALNRVLGDELESVRRKMTSLLQLEATLRAAMACECARPAMCKQGF